MNFKVGDIITDKSYTLEVMDIGNDQYLLKSIRDGSSAWFPISLEDDRCTLDEKYMLKKRFDEEMKEIINE